MGNGFSCVAKGDVKAGDDFEISGEVQMEVRGKGQKEEKSKEEEE